MIPGLSKNGLQARRAGRGLGLALVFAGALLGPRAGLEAQVLWDGSAGVLPAAQGWTFAALGSATQTLANGAVLLDTLLSQTTQAGYSLLSPVPLNRTNGFTLSFSCQVHSSTHANTNRAGFSLILLDNEPRGLELGFWNDRIFAQADSPLFVHGEEAMLPTTNTVVEYRVSFFATNYVLRANGKAVLSGPIRNYTPFNGFPNPYRTPNFIFLGDDTSSGAAAVSLREVVLFTPPVLQVQSPGILSWEGVAGKPYTVQTSADLVEWLDAAMVTSASGAFSYTNKADVGTGFLRVLVP